MDEKFIDFGSFVGSALLGAVIFYAPQIQALSNDPKISLVIAIAMMTLSNIGSRYAIAQVKQNAIQPEEAA